jgi:uncharacterized protein YqeY
MSELKARITNDMKDAMRAKDTAKLGTIRMLLAALKQKEVDERVELSDDDVTAIVTKQIKQRQEALTQYEAAQRMDLADIERFEMTVLQIYLPQQLSEAEVLAALYAAIAATGATGAQDMGKVMAILKPQLTGKTDLSKVSGLVKARLASPASA